MKGPEGSPEQSFESEIDPHSIAVVTGTYYPTWGTEKLSDTDKIRGGLSLEMIDHAQEKGFQIVVGDVGSSPEYMERLREKGIISNTKKSQGMSQARQQTFGEASKLEGAEVITWTEAEKISLIEDCLPEAIRPILDGRTDIVIPKRGEDAWATYPKFQREIEQRSNKQWNEILKANGVLPEDAEDLDIWFGPKFFKNDPELLKIFMEQYSFEKRGDLDLDKLVKPEMYTNALFFPVIQALSKGYRVTSVEVPYRNPAIQTNFEQDSPEFRRKRDMQRKDIMTNTLHFIRMLKGNPKGRLRKA
jgi:hypothetical protein